jgi:hypothetical protein
VGQNQFYSYVKPLQASPIVILGDPVFYIRPEKSDLDLIVTTTADLKGQRKPFFQFFVCQHTKNKYNAVICKPSGFKSTYKQFVTEFSA